MMLKKLLVLVALATIGLPATMALASHDGDGPSEKTCERSGQKAHGCAENPGNPDRDDDDGGDDDGEACPPASGPISGGVQGVSDGLAGGGAPAELTGAVDTVNCSVIVELEGAAGGGGEEPPAEEPPAEEPPAEEPPAEEPADCPPASGPISGGVQGVSDGLAGGGAPAELTGAVDTVNCSVIVELEGAAGGGGEEPPAEEPPAEEPPAEEPADCPPASGPISGGVQGVSDGLAGGGAPPELTGAVDTVNCSVIVELEGNAP